MEHSRTGGERAAIVMDVDPKVPADWAFLHDLLQSGRKASVILLTDPDGTASVAGLDRLPTHLRPWIAAQPGSERRPGMPGRRLRIDDAAKEVWLDGRLIPLSPKEYKLLALLASHPGRVFSSEEILEAVWPERPYEPGAEDVKKYIYFLRKKLERNPSKPELVLTVRGFGYKLNPSAY